MWIDSMCAHAYACARAADDVVNGLNLERSKEFDRTGWDTYENYSSLKNAVSLVPAPFRHCNSLTFWRASHMIPHAPTIVPPHEWP